MAAMAADTTTIPDTTWDFRTARMTVAVIALPGAHSNMGPVTTTRIADITTILVTRTPTNRLISRHMCRHISRHITAEVVARTQFVCSSKALFRERLCFLLSGQLRTTQNLAEYLWR